MDERKEAWLRGIDPNGFGAIDKHRTLLAQAAKLIRAYEAEREARIRLAAADRRVDEGLPVRNYDELVSAVVQASNTTDRTWKEALNAE